MILNLGWEATNFALSLVVCAAAVISYYASKRTRRELDKMRAEREATLLQARSHLRWAERFEGEAAETYRLAKLALAKARTGHLN